MRSIAFVLVGLLALLTGCATVQPLRPPADADASIHAVVADRLPTIREKYVVTDIPHSYFGVGRSLKSISFLDAMFEVGSGPVAIGNRERIGDENHDRAVRVARVASTDLGVILKSLVSHSSERPQYVLVPAAVFAFDNDDVYTLRCIVNADYDSGKGKPWHARYSVPAEGQFDLRDQDSSARAVAALQPCMVEAYRLFREHVTRTDGTYTTRTVHADIDFRMPVQDAALPTRIIGNDVLGLFEFRRSDVKSLEMPAGSK